MDINSDSDGDAEQAEEQAQRPQRRDRIPLHHFLRLIGGGRVIERDVASDNDELVTNLKRSGVIIQDTAIKAMRMCPRNMFVPEQHQDEAFTDSPIRLEELDFNVSAPHMHASCLEALQLEPGHKVLDVGAGCGIINACAAYMVGRTGLSVGIDIRKAAVKLAVSNIKRLKATSQDFATQASSCKIELHNVFMPSNKHQGKYDRVHVGASCPPDRLAALLPLLRPQGGIIVTPVSPNDLRMIKVNAKGDVTQKVISQVRYSELELPNDAEIIMATLKMKRHAQTAVPPPPSTYAQDVATITSHTGYSSSSGSSGSEQSGFMMHSSKNSTEVEGGDGSGSRRMWPTRVAKFLSSCSGNLGSTESVRGEDLMLQGPEDSGNVKLELADLGPTDLLLMGNGWSIPVHRHVLNNRSDLCRARHDSGMRDAEDNELHVPEHFAKDAIETFLHYLYYDKVDTRTSAQHAVAVLHVAHYYGAGRLVGLCEAILATELKRGNRDDEGTNEAAAALLVLADESGLAKLRAVCLDYIVHHYAAVSLTEGYKSLNSHQRDLIAAESCALYAHLRGMLREVAARKALPE
ncbi:hypothetical protein WJX79_005752 [Trebouxia sp. C0005]